MFICYLTRSALLGKGPEKGIPYCASVKTVDSLSDRHFRFSVIYFLKRIDLELYCNTGPEEHI